ncbi:hypothetical protein GA0116948_106193 [Chitinophaga costaii]|uniref:Uncharacterized protein n=2 Tax=Chitinophaga costaii TaxID=1335309 RepID=A0A1C4DYG5_9BACT|nr:hypothetical protein [Chitinophaga costaii]SCC36369.1 hypothetical protein GA0116948_106193 [Chitinophaga costaii]
MDCRFARWKGISGVSLLLFLAACMRLQAPVTASTERFRDLPAYFASEKKQMEQAGLQFHKLVEQNGVRDSIITSDTGIISKLLKPFAGINLNKPSLRDQYILDSVTNGFSGARSLSYTARTPEVNPQQVLLETDSSGYIQSVQIISRTSNLLYKTASTLIYEHLKTVSVSTDQQVVLLSPQHLSVQVRMYPKP